ncbi:hypothetical protein JAAARDRAFT_560385 [Jaapia argillacea MUCL 33604]|uniref:Rab-GAP TBC domain-containing protein n=1 Tax=Jaapia argillacea MUCL 33604 TaxID=933084 RepID=A0A067QB49_9AGAM|nr:hypothetical protein JAAARDRAFT_560385 [Jaapia argillacea MUCL 33604]
MATSTWDPIRVKAHLQLAGQRLSQLQSKKDSDGQITRRDIATLLQQGNIGLARAKAQKLFNEDALIDVMAVLEMQTAFILEHFGELEQSSTPSRHLVESVSSIIYAAPELDYCKELEVVRDHLMRRLGPDFSRSAINNRDNHVAPRVVRGLNAPPPTAAALDELMYQTAKAYGVQWAPELRPHERLQFLSELLDPNSSTPAIDISRLRRLSVQGIPDQPSWLRPRIWRLLLGNLPLQRSSWEIESGKQRESYYDLVRRLLTPFSDMPPPTSPLATLDASLLAISKELSRVPPNLFSDLEDQPESSSLCPLDDVASEDIRVNCAGNLDARLRLIQDRDSHEALPQVTPEIRLDSNHDGTPEISLSTPESPSALQINTPTTLVPSKTYRAGGAHQKHSSALLRLLFVHSSLNPAHRSPHLASLLVPLYYVLNQEIEQRELAHVEADTFWVFEAMVGEFAELEDEADGCQWMKKLGARVAWADEDIFTSLCARGLDPSLPHYSYRWLAPLLTHTLPLPSAIVVWDALFSCPMRSRDSNPKLEYLLDICTSMLIRAKGPMSRLGKPGAKSRSLWSDESEALPPPSPFRPWELSDAFVEGMAFLQAYPIDAVGGVESILQTSYDLAQRRLDEMKVAKGASTSIGTRLRNTVWRGLTNQISESSLEEEEEEEDSEEDQDSHDDGNETETPALPSTPGITSRLASSVWKGFTNQSLEATPSPVASPTSPVRPSSMPVPSPSPSSPQETPSPAQRRQTLVPSSIWGYAEKLKDSDTAAKLAKASTNWRVKALGAWSRGTVTPSPSAPSSPPSSPPTPPTKSLWGSVDHGRRGSLSSTTSDPTGTPSRRSTIEHDDPNRYSPPPRPAFFKTPRDSMLPQPRRDTSSTSLPTSPDSSESGSSLLNKTKNIQASLANLTSRHQPDEPPKAGPRPLLLSSRKSVLKASSSSQSMSHSQGQWAEVMRTRGHLGHSPSQASVSSVSTNLSIPDALAGTGDLGSRLDVDAEAATSSRKVPLHRSRSPMAPMFRLPRERDSMSSRASSETSSPVVIPRHVPTGDTRQPSVDSSSERGWGRIDRPESPSPPPPRTPTTSGLSGNGVKVQDTEYHRGSVVLTEASDVTLEPPHPSRKLTRKKTPPPNHFVDVGDSDSSVPPVPPIPKGSRGKSRRVVKPAAITLQDKHYFPTTVVEQRAPSPNSLAVEWPQDYDTAPTPRASTFNSGSSGSPASPSSPRSPRRGRKVSGEGRDGQDSRTRKTSTGTRTRKISTEGRRTTESAAEEGDDEGYDDLLSAYESEDAPLR